MASAPETVNLQTQDFPAESKPLLDKLLPILQRQFDAVRTNVAGGLTRANSAGQDLTVTINTPATDWITASLTNNATSTDANSNGFASPRYRYIEGGLAFDGACEASPTGTGTGTVAIPWVFINNIPIPFGAPTGSSPGANVDVCGNFVEVNTTGVFHAITWANAALIRYRPGAGTLELRSAGSGNPASPWGIPFLSTTCTFNFPGFVIPPLSCFPITVQTTVQNPTRVTVSKVLDVTTPVTNISYVSPGGLSWDVGSPGSIIIKNLTGLALGRSYSVQLYVEP